MSLGLFNCRLIQPAGDQLFFFSAVLPRRCQFGQALFSLLVTRPARPRPTGGRRILLVFPSQKDFVLVFRGAKSPRAQKGSLPTIHPRISPKIPQSYPQIPLQTPLSMQSKIKNADPDKKYRRVLAASTLAGDSVRNSAGEDLGKVDEIMIDIPSGR